MTTMPPSTFGKATSAARRAKGLSQKELAALISKEDGQPITPQYLNDIEHDRRSPSSEHMVQQFAERLGLSVDYLSWLVGKLPSSVKRENVDPRHVEQAFMAFRKALDKAGP
jgi:transcriptional regulator with XRE-family HTH domain